MGQDRYLDYVRALHDRLSKRSSQTGLTTWALLAALAYLLMQLPGLLSNVQRPDWQFPVLLGWAHLQVAAEAGFLLMTSLRGKNPPNKFSYRIRRIENISDITLATVGIVLLCGLPAVLSWGAAANPSGISEAERFVLGANKWIFGALLAAFLAFMVAFVWSYRFSEYPSTMFLKQHHSSTASVFSFGMDLLMAILVISNLYFFIHPLLSSPKYASGAVTTIPLVLVFILVIIRTLLGSLTQQRSLEWLENLERDIVIHNITEPEIRDRLEREYLGRELGGLLKRRVDQIRVCVDELQQFATEADAKLEEIAHLDANLIYEKGGRIKAILQLLENKSDELMAQWSPLSKWLKKAVDAPWQDPYLKDLAVRTVKELGAEIERGQTASRSCIDKIKRVVAGFNSTGAQLPN